jgi:hypothetical protein
MYQKRSGTIMMEADIAKTSCPSFSSIEVTSWSAREQAGDGETTPDEVGLDSARKTIRMILVHQPSSQSTPTLSLERSLISRHGSGMHYTQ